MGSSPYTARVIRPSEYRTGPWKNKRGFSTQIAIHPPAANYAREEPFDWRVAIARIDPPGPTAPPGPIPFSPLPEKQRLMMLIEGDGVRLHHRYHRFRRTVELTHPFEPYEFQGEWTTTCELLGAEARDFNVMVERADWRAKLAAYDVGERGMESDFLEGAYVLFYCHKGTAEAHLNSSEEKLQVRTAESLLLTRREGSEENDMVDITGKTQDALVIGVYLFRRSAEGDDDADPALRS